MQPDINSMTAPALRSIALVIDDAPETLGMISEALENNGMTVLVARSGPEGIDLARRVQPDVILMDADMPEMDGFETCRLLKSAPNPEPAPVIFMTGLSEPENILRGLRAGGVDYITKPVVVDELIARIITHVLNARAIASARRALEHAGQSVLAFLSDGTLAWGAPSALAMVDMAASGAPLTDAGASAGLRAWLSALPDQPISSAQPYVGAGVALKYLGQSGGEVFVGVKRHHEGAHGARLSAAFGLTEREAEVLFWLTRGKTNRDIAEILDLSARTVNKHLEQVFHKMGVDNRTSAAVIADRVLND